MVDTCGRRDRQRAADADSAAAALAEQVLQQQTVKSATTLVLRMTDVACRCKLWNNSLQQSKRKRYDKLVLC